MNSLNHSTLLYLIIVGLTVILYIKKWGELLQVRRYSIYFMVPLFWSVVFLLLLLPSHQIVLQEHSTPKLFLIQLITPCLYYIIGMLLFPDTTRLDSKDQFAYLDYYECFRKQISWIMGIALLAFCLQFWLFWNVETPHLTFLASICAFLNFQVNGIVLISLFIAFFAEHKGLMLCLAWLLIGSLLFFT